VSAGTAGVGDGGIGGSGGAGHGGVGRLDTETASRYAEVGLANVAREYPNHPGHLLEGPADLVPPSQLHPIFFGSYDWHSSVHQHWMLVRLCRRFPALPAFDAVETWFDERCTDQAGAVEAAYLAAPGRAAWERPYGWAWAMTLVSELRSWAGDGHAGAARWAAALEPLQEVVRGRALAWLRRSPYPQRSGTHQNSAFAAGLLWDAAIALRDDELRDTVDAAADRWYADDEGYPAWLEPSASDFLSPVLVVADLQRRRLPAEAFSGWFARLLPDPVPLLAPAVVVDRTDPQIVHLDGLNLSRAWCWARIGRCLLDRERSHAALAAAERHAAASMPAVLDHYVGSPLAADLRTRRVRGARRRRGPARRLITPPTGWSHRPGPHTVLTFPRAIWFPPAPRTGCRTRGRQLSRQPGGVTGEDGGHATDDHGGARRGQPAARRLPG
jgi:hypothetical protein